MQFDQDTIKDLAVYAVQQFVSNQVPLNESIAEKARGLQLNEDQVRRVVESCAMRKSRRVAGLPAMLFVRRHLAKGALMPLRLEDRVVAETG